jgi:hypothetical protein
MRGEEKDGRPPFVYWTCLWGVGLALAVVSIFEDFTHHYPHLRVGRDFVNLWIAGRLVTAGDPWCVFDIDCFRAGLVHNAGLVTLQNYSYPPHALFIAVPFSLLPYNLALALWTVLGSLFFIFAARKWLPAGMPLYLAILTPAAGINIWNGHYGFLIGGLWLLYFFRLPRSPVRAGVTAGLMTFKPHLGLMIAVSMLRRPKVIALAILTALVLIVSSAVLFGPDAWMSFLHSTTHEQTDILTRTDDEFYFRLMPSPYITFGRGLFGTAAQLLFGCSAAACLVKFRRLDVFTAATATFLIVPYVFNYDMTVACLGFAALLFDRWGSLEFWERATLSLAFLVPEMSYVPVLRLLCAPVLLLALIAQCRLPPVTAHEPQRTSA